MAVRITWLGHASVCIKGSSATVYIDPWKIRQKDHADIILLTHDHYDHYSEFDIKTLTDETSRIVAPMSTPVVTDLIAAGSTLKIKDIGIRAIPAYNLSKAFHPKANGWVGYVVEIDGKKIYHPGDTDRIPEMKGLSVDVAFIPVGGTYTMDAREAAGVFKDISAEHAVPIHYGDIVGSKKDAEQFSELCACNVHILSPGGSFEID
ncbi:MAG TPA: MBL fold metallo-hydrolase [Deltaproteobacteria bacterium]|nr:MBL fold metallo-hydrolase [Deltaproteobacteria bacterium]HPR53578.1 MBL fold metallo-hydrolase [Deltaproteobacteria bacterium]HXK47631.1 MBL fold metallo-hydrolase [Deltaproteobacteria bacterium]